MNSRDKGKRAKKPVIGRKGKPVNNELFDIGKTKRVILESPFRGDTPEQELENIRYLTKCIRDSLDRGEAPFASHQMYTTALSDAVPEERRIGIQRGYLWAPHAAKVVFYVDRGWSRGMDDALAHHRQANRPCFERGLEGWERRLVTGRVRMPKVELIPTTKKVGTLELHPLSDPLDWTAVQKALAEMAIRKGMTRMHLRRKIGRELGRKHAPKTLTAKRLLKILPEYERKARWPRRP